MSEILMVVSIPVFSGALWRWREDRLFLFVIVSIVASFAGIVLSDLVFNEVHVYNHLRGMARIFIFVVYLLFWLGVMTTDFRLVRSYLWGLVPGSVIGVFYVSQYDMASVRAGWRGYEFWLYKVSPVLTSTVFLVGMLVYWRRRWIFIVAIIGTVTTIAVNASRSDAATLLTAGIVAGLLSLRGRFSRGLARIRLKHSIVLCILLISGIYFAYLGLAPAGYLGEHQREKFEKQTNTVYGATPWGIIMFGRAASVGSVNAALERPLFGHGSWSVPHYYIFDAYEMLGVDLPAYKREEEVMGAQSAGHTVLFGAWAANGILAVPVWLIALLLCGKLSILAVRIETAYTPYFIYLATASTFTILFNPLSSISRASIGLVVASALVLNQLDKRRRCKRNSAVRHEAGCRSLNVSDRRCEVQR